MMMKKVKKKTITKASKKAKAKLDTRIFRVASIALTNAMLFQELLSQRTSVQPLRNTVSQLDIVDGFVSQWEYITKKIDFVPIFDTARRILLTLPSSPEINKALRILAISAIKISNNRAALRHDLMGRIFHKLLADAKYFGAFYTKIPSATLLLKLTIDNNDWNVDWSNPASVGKIKVADLACGTGTLLKSTLSAIVDKHITESVASNNRPDPDEIHKQVVENSLYGFDILTSAVHIAAAAIAMHNPNVPVNKMNLYPLPLGGKSEKLGSIEFAKTSTKSVIPIQKTLYGKSIGPANTITKKQKLVQVPPLSLCTMNPPFTRSVFGNLLFGGIKQATRKNLQKKLQKVIKDTKMKANVTAGLGPVFIAVADNMLSKNGVLSLVTPKTILNGLSWAPTREIFQNYELQFIICSHELANWNFSESTKLSEVLLVLKKGHSESSQVIFVNLWKQPKTSIESLTLAREIQKATPADLSGKSGTCEIKIGNQKFAELSALSNKELRSISWAIPLSFAQTDLCRIAYHLAKNEVFIPGQGKVANFKTVKFSDLVVIGPDGRDIKDGFSLTDSPTTFQALWGYDSNLMKNLKQKPNKYLNPLTTPLPGRPLRDANLLWGRAGTLMLPKELRLTTSCISAVVLDNPALSNVWWPCRWISDDDTIRKKMEKVMSLWFNSTLGLLTLFMQRQDTEGPWVKFAKAWYQDLNVFDIRTLTNVQINSLLKLWDNISNSNFSLFAEIKNDKIRKQIDDEFCKILKIKPIDEIRKIISREPIITG